MDKDFEQELVNGDRLYDEMKDNGYKDYNDMIRKKSYEQASRDYERYLSNGGYYG